MTSWNMPIGIVVILVGLLLIVLLRYRKLNWEKLNKIYLVFAISASVGGLCLLFAPSAEKKETISASQSTATPISTSHRDEPLESARYRESEEIRSPAAYPSGQAPSNGAIYLHFRRDAFNQLLGRDLDSALRSLRKAAPYATEAGGADLSNFIAYLASVRSDLQSKAAGKAESEWKRVYTTILGQFPEIIEKKYCERLNDHIRNPRPPSTRPSIKE